MDEQRKPIPWYWWTVAGLLLLVAYPLSLGPMGWLFTHSELQHSDWACGAIECVYWPLVELVEISPDFRAVAIRYLDLWFDCAL